MQLTSSPRRALGLVAVGALGMSTAVLGVTGTATAATTSYTFSTAPDASTDQKGVTTLEVTTIPSGSCTVDFLVEGAGGGSGFAAGTSQSAWPGGSVTGSSSAIDGDMFDLSPGTRGGDGTTAAGTAGTNADGYDGQVGYTDGVDVFGGGGGGASTVARSGDSVILGAFGGNGALHDPSNGLGGNAGANILHADGVAGTPGNTGPGVISGTVTCTTVDPVAPGAPTLAAYVQVGDGTAEFRFTPGAQGDAHPVSYEYELDDGGWTAFTPGFTGSDDLTGTLTGLTNLKKYSLSVRATSTAGTSAASAPVTFAPFRPVATPAGVSASVGLTSVRISWTPAADAAGTVGYEAFALPDGQQHSGGVALCATADASATSCTVAVEAGLSYGFGVAGLDALGNRGAPVFGENPTAVVPASAVAPTLPEANGTLSATDADGKVVAGEKVTISGTDFLPGSVVELVVYSTPVKLGEATVLSDGTFSATVTLPEDMASGTHHLVATGVDVNGNVRNLVVEVTVSGGSAALALTGFSALPYAGAGALALLTGGGLLVAARRRQVA